MRLFDIGQAYRDWQLKIAEQEGELTEEDLKVFEELEGATEDKIDAYAVIIKESLAEAEVFKAEADRLLAIAKKKSNLADRLKNNLDYFMKTQGREKFESLKTIISYRKSTVLEIEDNANIPADFQKIETKADKTKIKEFLCSGGTLDGCSLITKQNIQVK